jgi:uncharacterized membrane protein YdjX (TVP38/TMEM64 family)
MQVFRASGIGVQSQRKEIQEVPRGRFLGGRGFGRSFRSMKEILEARNTLRKAATVRARDLLFVVAGLLFVVGLAWTSRWLVSLHAVDLQRLAASWRGGGLAGPLWCIALQALQVVFFFIPGEVFSFAAGYVFGTWHGLAYSFAGITAGSAFNFYLARIVGRPALARIIKPSRLERVDRLLAGADGRFAIFTLFLVSIGPTDALCYGAGFSAMSLPEFAAISGVARIPGILFDTYLGARAATHNFGFVILAGLAGLAIFGSFYLYRRHKAPNNASVRQSGNPSLSP